MFPQSPRCPPCSFTPHPLFHLCNLSCVKRSDSCSLSQAESNPVTRAPSTPTKRSYSPYHAPPVHGKLSTLSKGQLHLYPKQFSAPRRQQHRHIADLKTATVSSSWVGYFREMSKVFQSGYGTVPSSSLRKFHFHFLHIYKRNPQFISKNHLQDTSVRSPSLKARKPGVGLQFISMTD